MAILKYKTDLKKFSELKDQIQIPIFQRGLVWGKKKKEGFIDNFKAGLPIGVLLLSEEDDHFLVIDGLQRFSTMKEYAKNPFLYVKESEISDTEIMSIILASDQASTYYNLHDSKNQERIRDGVRKAITNSIRNGYGKNDLVISQEAATEVCKSVNEFDDKDVNALLNPIFSVVQTFKNNASIDNIEIPIIIFFGSGDELVDIFQKLNQEGVKLSKYDVFAATWNHSKVIIKNDSQFISYVIKKYEKAQDDSDISISNFDPDEMKKSGELTVFEYAFALGKALMNSCPLLFTKDGDDGKVESIGFLLLAELMGLTYQTMGQLADTIDKYKNVDYKELKDDIIECAKIVEDALGRYIISPNKKISLCCHSELQLASYIIVLFKLKYEITEDKGIVPKLGTAKSIKNIKFYLYKHYLYDIIRGYWSGSGDSKLEEIIAEPETCIYMLDVDRSKFESAILEWLESANRKSSLANVSADTKLFLNYLLRERVHDVDKRSYDIEHCVPKKILEKYLIDKGITVPISAPCNLVYIPSTENQSKKEDTYYQRQSKQPDTYKLDANELDKLVYPTKSELQFVESVDTLTESNYRKYLKDRETVVLKAMMNALYK